MNKLLRKILRLPFALLKSAWKLLCLSWSVLSTFLIVALLATNVLTLVSSTAYRLASSAIDTIYDGASLRSRSQNNIAHLEFEISQSKLRVSELDNDLSQVRREKEALQSTLDLRNGQNAGLQENTSRLQARVARIEADIADELVKSSQLVNQLEDAQALARVKDFELNQSRARSATIEEDLNTFRARSAAQTNMIDVRTRAITNRSRDLVVREVASMPLESVPWIGIATIVAVTALELKDMCDTSTDMQAIREIFDLSEPGIDGSNSICGTKVPTVSELKERVLNGKDGQIREHCRQIAELGLPRPNECPEVPSLPPMPADAPAPDHTPKPPPPRPSTNSTPVDSTQMEGQILPPRP